MRGISVMPSSRHSPKTGSLYPWVSAWSVSGWIAERFFISPSRIWIASQTPQGMKLVNSAMELSAMWW
jgi:hypothetical protein